MKKVFFALIIIAGLTACNQANKTQNNSVTEQTEKSEQNTAVITVDEMLDAASQYVDKEVTFKGFVTHTCSHSGKRCFLQGDKDITIRVEAKGKIGGFNRELIGNQIAVTGTLKEKRLTEAEINDMEKVIEEKSLKDDGSEESCDTERANVQEMRDWMKANNKDYFAIYYVDGLSYEEL